MAITLIARPDIPPMSFAQFIRDTPPFAVALDGYVNEGPKFKLLESSNTPSACVYAYANFNHHEGVSRLETRSTCAQVMMAIRMGLYDAFMQAGERELTAYVNDCDEDVCVSWYLLSHPHMSRAIVSPLLNRLVAMEDVLDSTAGAYPFPTELPVLEELAWVFDPYRQFRAAGRLGTRDADAFRCIIEDVGHRIEKHISGSGSSIKLDTRYNETVRCGIWSSVDETGRHARLGMFANGIKAYVSVRPRAFDGGTLRFDYTIGRASPFVPFDVLKILKKLNEAEPASSSATTPHECWGGSDLVGGSPRILGSRLSPAEVEGIIKSLYPPSR